MENTLDVVKRFNGRVYALRSYSTPNIYIGSTTRALSSRLNSHRQFYKSFLKGEHNYVTAYDMFKFSDVRIELISFHENVTKEELHRFEGEAIRNTPEAINKNIAGQTSAEYKEIHREAINENARIKHKCACGGKYTNSYSSDHKISKRYD